MNNYLLKKCIKCGALVRIIKDCKCNDCGIICCGEAMHDIQQKVYIWNKVPYVPTL